MEYVRDEQRMHLIVYRLVWATKRRRKILKNKIEKACRKLIQNKCLERGWKLVVLDVRPDWVQLLVQVWPTDSAFEVVKACKAVTSHELRRHYPVLLKMPSLWTRSYFATTDMPDNSFRTPMTEISLFLEAQSRT